MSELVTAAQKSKKAADKAKACDAAREINDLFATASMSAPQGAMFNKDGGTQIMTALQQVSGYPDQVKTLFSCKGW
jgi:hypothetical protein